MNGRGKKAAAAAAGAGFLMVAAGCGSAATATPASATSAANFYHGKVVNLIVPNAPGGKMDEYARMIAPYLAKALGAAQIQVDDVQGAAGVVGLNQLWASPKNGYTIGFTNADVPLLTSLLKSPGVTYQGAKFTWLGNVDSEPRMLVVGKKSGISNVQQLEQLKSPFKYPSAGFDDDFYIMIAMSQTLHFPLKVITGYSSQGETLQSIVTGATDGESSGITPVQSLIRSGELSPILAVADHPVPGYTKVPLWKNVVTGKGKALASSLGEMVLMTRSFMGPPGMNPTAVKLLRAALAKAMKNPALLAKAKAAHFPLAFTPGSQEQKTIATIADQFAKFVPNLVKATAAYKK